jgi:hypothetical protein
VLYNALDFVFVFYMVVSGYRNVFLHQQTTRSMPKFVVSSRRGLLEITADEFMGSSDVGNSDMDAKMYKEFKTICYDARREELGSVALAASLARRDIAELIGKVPDLPDDRYRWLKEHLYDYEGQDPIEAYNILRSILETPAPKAEIMNYLDAYQECVGNVETDLFTQIENARTKS